MKYLDNMLVNTSYAFKCFSRASRHSRFLYCVLFFAIIAPCGIYLNDKTEERLHDVKDIEPLFTISVLAHLLNEFQCSFCLALLPFHSGCLPNIRKQELKLKGVRNFLSI